MSGYPHSLVKNVVTSKNTLHASKTNVTIEAEALSLHHAFTGLARPEEEYPEYPGEVWGSTNLSSALARLDCHRSA